MRHFSPRRVSTIATASALCLAASSCNSSDPASDRTAIAVGGGGSGGGGTRPMGGSTADSGTDAGGVAISAPDQDAATNANETCWFEELDDWVVCEDAGPPYIVVVDGEASTQDCADACLADADCTAIFDYYWRGWDDFGCTLHISTCDNPRFDEFAEGDGAKTFRKVCGESPPSDAITEFDAAGGIVVDPDSGCVFRSPVPPEVCENHGDPDLEIVGGSSLSECLELCQGREDCSAVKDKPMGDYDGVECLLHIATCETLVPDQLETPEDLTYYYRKECTADGAD